MSHILIISATKDEVNRLLKNIDSSRNLSVGGRTLVEGVLGENRLRILVSGPGQANTVQALTACIENKRPGMIIQTGCAGVFENSSLGIGDLGIATEVFDIHLGVESKSHSLPEPLPFYTIEKQGMKVKNHYPMNHGLAMSAKNILKKRFFQNQVKVKKGPFVSVSTITSSEKRKEMLWESFSPVMEEMEGAGCAHAAIHYDSLPLIMVRAGSNFVGDRDHGSWNLPLAFERSNAAVLTLLKNMDELQHVV